MEPSRAQLSTYPPLPPPPAAGFGFGAMTTEVLTVAGQGLEGAMSLDHIAPSAPARQSRPTRAPAGGGRGYLDREAGKPPAIASTPDLNSSSHPPTIPGPKASLPNLGVASSSPRPRSSACAEPSVARSLPPDCAVRRGQSTLDLLEVEAGGPGPDYNSHSMGGRKPSRKRDLYLGSVWWVAALGHPACDWRDSLSCDSCIMTHHHHDT